jgi:soluble lytic murein transglycosylase-like protein
MRLLLVPACAIAVAWSALPTGLFSGSIRDNGVIVASIPERSTDGSGSHEANDDALEARRHDTAEPVNAFYSQPSPLDRAEMKFFAEPGTRFAVSLAVPRREFGDALSALDEVAREPGLERPDAIPLPPRRAIPHAIVCEALAAAAERNDVPVPFLVRLIWQESGFNQNAVSPVGAQGVAQFMPETASERGLDDPFNPLQAVRASARMLRHLIDRFGNLGLAAAAYNAGPKRVQDWLARHGNLPQETRDYVQRITGLSAEAWASRNVSAVALHAPEHAPCQVEPGLFAANGPEQIPLPPGTHKVEAKIAAKAEPKTTVKAEAKLVEAKADAKSKAKPAAIKVAMADVSKAEEKRDGSHDGKHEPTHDAKSAVKAAVKPAEKPAAKTVASAGKKAAHGEFKVADATPQDVSRSAPKSAPKSASRSHAAEEPKREKTSAPTARKADADAEKTPRGKTKAAAAKPATKDSKPAAKGKSGKSHLADAHAGHDKPGMPLRLADAKASD